MIITSLCSALEHPNMHFSVAVCERETGKSLFGNVAQKWLAQSYLLWSFLLRSICLFWSVCQLTAPSVFPFPLSSPCFWEFTACVGARDPSPCQTSLSFVIPGIVSSKEQNTAVQGPSLGTEHRSRTAGAGGEERKMQIPTFDGFREERGCFGES